MADDRTDDELDPAYTDDLDADPAAPEAGDEDGPDQRTPAEIAAFALLGAAIGAGLGFLASRALAEPPPIERARRVVRRPVRRAARAGEAAFGDASDAIGEAVRALGRTREELGDRIEHELRALRKMVRKSRRRGMWPR